MPDYKNNLLDIIYQLESSAGQNRRAYKPNKYGALGGYQLTPGAYQEVQKWLPEVWRGKSFNEVATNDKLAREAASQYTDVLNQQLLAKKANVTNAMILAAYHSGAGNAARNTLGPYGRDYVAKARALAGVKPGEVW